MWKGAKHGNKRTFKNNSLVLLIEPFILIPEILLKDKILKFMCSNYPQFPCQGCTQGFRDVHLPPVYALAFCTRCWLIDWLSVALPPQHLFLSSNYLCRLTHTTVPNNTVQYNAVHNSTVQYSSVKYSTVQYSTV